MTFLTSAAPPTAPTAVQQLVAQASVQFADRPALVLGSRTLTYREMAEQAERLSAALLAEAPEQQLVGISTACGFGMVVGVLAILQAGKAYVPLDPAYPAGRLRRLAGDAQLRHCLAPAGQAELFAGLGLQVLATDASYPAAPPAPAAAAGPLAYVLYTSGSTGEPKGVCMGHAALANLLRWQQTQSAAGPGTRTLQFAPLSFDVSFQEIFATLSTGGTLVLLDEAQRQDMTVLLDYIDYQQVNRVFLPFVALQQLAEAAVGRAQLPASLRELITAGEQLKITPQLAAFCAGLPGCALFNQYGPTECHVVTQLTLRGDPANWERLPAIGQPIANTTVHLLDAELREVLPGEVGELCIGGVALAEGYLGQPARTNEKFIAWTGSAGQPQRLYRSGDLARQRPDGNLEFLGRQDEQVKIRGHRVELGEVEAALATLSGVGQVAVQAWPSPAGLQELVAYVVPADPAAPPTPAALRRAAAKELPDYLLPASFVLLPAFPQTSSGKINRRALPAPAQQRRAALGLPYHPPRTPTERHLAAAWAALLRFDEVGAQDNFFELGGTSLLAQQCAAQLRARHGYHLPAAKLYQYPTVATAAAYLATPAAAPLAVPAPVTANELADIAIIGMAGRFPGAATPEALWEVLREGRETIHFFKPDELDASLPPALRQDARYVPARGIIDHVEEFEPALFGFSPRLAAALDPQQRVLLEVAREALEQAGCLPGQYAGRVGVFAGVGNNYYYQHNVLANPAASEQLGAFQVMTANEKDYAATRVAHALDLRGPAVGVYAACATSLLAVAQAVQSLRAGQCEVALAGGASVAVPVRSGYLHDDGAMTSPDGHCRPFAAGAQGTVFSDGAGALVLKPLAAARRDGDLVHAIIRGVGVSNDGRAKASFTAPSAAGQAAAIAAALADARVGPASISYVEAHGTGTPLGDPIELAGLRLAFGAGAGPGSCGLGSLKSNLGHLTAAAGVAGLLKVVLALQHRQLPASLHFREPNPQLELEASPFFIPTALRSWPAGPEPRRAGVSSFGVGGTNVHVVVEEAPAPLPSAPAGRPWQLLAWSARTAGSAAAYAGQLADWLPAAPALADVAYSLHTTRVPLAERRVLVAATTAEAQVALRQPEQLAANHLARVPGAVVFLFPGQGAQRPGMGCELYAHEPVFRAVVDECADLLREFLGLDLRTLLYPAGPAAAPTELRAARYAQPALFVTEYALACLWQSWGVQPTALCGHSLGELVAACLAGVFSLPAALQLVAERGRLMGGLPPGQLLAVRAPAAELAALLPPTLDLAAVNGRRAAVVAGPAADIAAFATELTRRQLPNRVLASEQAFHSRLVEPAVAGLLPLLATLPLAAPRLPIVSTVSGTWLTDEQATDPAYWARQLRAPVQFAAALDTLLTEPTSLLLEMGPGITLTALARQQAAGLAPSVLAVAALPGPTAAEASEYPGLLAALGQAWLHGLEPDWRAFYAGQARQRLALPGYCYERQRYWLDPAPAPPISTTALPTPPAPATAFTAVTASSSTPSLMRQPLLEKVLALLGEAADLELTTTQAERSFWELGFDSLSLTQVVLTLRKNFAVPLTFRQLSESVPTPAALADYLAAHLPAEATPPAALAATLPVPAPGFVPGAGAPAPAAESALDLINAQLQLLARQVALLQGGAAPAATTPPTAPASLPPAGLAPVLTAEEAAEHAKPFGATARIERRAANQLSARQQRFLHQLTARYTRRTAASKRYTQQHRPHMADPRVVTGFAPPLKKLTYPLVVDKSAGSHLWDLDGHEYVDALNGFGSSLFGHQPEFIKTALHEQVERGYEVGPQHALAGEVCQLLCQLTGQPRAALCNTGSEAVLGALRMARTVTGRSLVVAFSGSYHGINDEVLVRGTRQLQSRPAAPGILPEAVQNMLILDYGTDESLRILAARAPELAAVLVEPVQSRRPDFQPVAFLQEVRRITAASGTALIFDEVITGFRLHLGGAQATFGVRADLATYGKVIGGGLPIGAIAGSRTYMDALDGGQWQYDDNSVPEVGVTYFAGTFVRHPLALAAARASLRHLQAAGPGLQDNLNASTERLAGLLNATARQLQVPVKVVYAGSLWKIKFTAELPYPALLFTLLRERGVHIWDNFPCFLTTAHSEADLQLLVQAFTSSLAELKAEFWELTPADEVPLTAAPVPPAAPLAALNQPPVPGARLGRDPAGNPAWFLADPDRPGRYVQLGAPVLA